MANIYRLYTFKAGDEILATPLNNELNQIVDLLNGTSTDKGVLIRCSTTDTGLKLIQLGVGSVAQFFSGSTLIARIPGASDTPIPEDIVTVKNLPDFLFAWSESFFNEGTLTTSSYFGTYIVPNLLGGTLVLDGLRGLFRAGGGGTDSIIKAYKNGVEIATLTLTGSDPTVVGVVDDLALTLVENDKITFVVTQKGSDRNDVTVALRGKLSLGA